MAGGLRSGRLSDQMETPETEREEANMQATPTKKGYMKNLSWPRLPTPKGKTPSPGRPTLDKGLKNKGKPSTTTSSTSSCTGSVNRALSTDVMEENPPGIAAPPPPTPGPSPYQQQGTQVAGAIYSTEQQGPTPSGTPGRASSASVVAAEQRCHASTSASTSPSAGAFSHALPGSFTAPSPAGFAAPPPATPGSSGYQHEVTQAAGAFYPAQTPSAVPGQAPGGTFAAPCYQSLTPTSATSLASAPFSGGPTAMTTGPSFARMFAPPPPMPGYSAFVGHQVEAASIARAQRFANSQAPPTGYSYEAAMMLAAQASQLQATQTSQSLPYLQAGNYIRGQDAAAINYFSLPSLDTGIHGWGGQVLPAPLQGFQRFWPPNNEQDLQVAVPHPHPPFSQSSTEMDNSATLNAASQRNSYSNRRVRRGTNRGGGFAGTNRYGGGNADGGSYVGGGGYHPNRGGGYIRQGVRGVNYERRDRGGRSGRGGRRENAWNLPHTLSHGGEYNPVTPVYCNTGIHRPHYILATTPNANGIVFSPGMMCATAAPCYGNQCSLPYGPHM